MQMERAAMCWWERISDSVWCSKRVLINFWPIWKNSNNDVFRSTKRQDSPRIAQTVCWPIYSLTKLPSTRKSIAFCPIARIRKAFWSIYSFTSDWYWTRASSDRLITIPPSPSTMKSYVLAYLVNHQKRIRTQKLIMPQIGNWVRKRLPRGGTYHNNKWKQCLEHSAVDCFRNTAVSCCHFRDIEI